MGWTDDKVSVVSALLAAAALLAILVILGCSKSNFAVGQFIDAQGRAFDYKEGMQPAPDDQFEPASGVDGAFGAPQRRSVYSALSRLYSTADVDPLVTGRLYGHRDGIRDVYAERTSHGDVYGLAEYSSAGGAGDVGVDIGPNGLDEYGGKEIGFDDGIPEQWAFPSTPVRWYGEVKRDNYGPEGPTPYMEGVYSLFQPDHDPLTE